MGCVLETGMGSKRGWFDAALGLAVAAPSAYIARKYGDKPINIGVVLVMCGVFAGTGVGLIWSKGDDIEPWWYEVLCLCVMIYFAIEKIFSGEIAVSQVTAGILPTGGLIGIGGMAKRAKMHVKIRAMAIIGLVLCVPPFVAGVLVMLFALLWKQ